MYHFLRTSIFTLRYISFLERLNMQFFYVEITNFLMLQVVLYRTQVLYTWDNNDTMRKVKFVSIMT